jgi:hypothetical protein
MNRGKEKRTITLKIGSIYHFMNITYIHLRVKSLNMYIYKMRIYKKLLKNTIIKNVNTYLIKHTYFEQSSNLLVDTASRNDFANSPLLHT